ncbi:MAG: hypothetical protein KKC98_12780 [Alphaproteobacteria bacterium]|nr:hypothetical protein [Alphaproteobacteria bacterium]
MSLADNSPMSLGDAPMPIGKYMDIVTGSEPEDWAMIHRPTLRHRFTEMRDEKDRLMRLTIDEPMVAFAYKPNIEISLLFGLVQDAFHALPAGNAFAEENARTMLLDCFHCGQLVHREVLLKIDRQRCILPLPDNWEPGPQPVPVPRRQHDLARLIHLLAGPFSDFDDYFKRAGMVLTDRVWP